MKNAIKKGWHGILPMLFFLSPLFLHPPGYSAALPLQVLTCPPPDVVVTDKTSDSVTFSWSTFSGATYKAWYYRSEDSFTSSEVTTGSSSITFSDLPPGTYDFYFATVCGEEVSSYIVVDDLIM
ncbi:MAG: fibronectin type III domain-containing protein [Saprospiraceae bacterium]|nr:fibronectin type III domain-containing protein [Saprospiraceae bacterium]MCB0577418.1 fibronectin type III domain-containing protein [Saprospiraceae bacterium]MCB9353549.1 fibronectin type III domain-containing protein [Lewinellaceae bacterium]